MVAAPVVAATYAAAPAGTAARLEILGRVGAPIPRRRRGGTCPADGMDTVGVPEPVGGVNAAAKTAAPIGGTRRRGGNAEGDDQEDDHNGNRIFHKIRKLAAPCRRHSM